jgi:hypothetical protein
MQLPKHTVRCAISTTQYWGYVFDDQTVDRLGVTTETK